MSATEIQSDRASEQISGDVAAEYELSKDKIFHLLQTPRRRYVLQYLKEHNGPVDMRDLAEQVAAWENDVDIQALSSDQRQRVYIPLYQSHLPKLDEEGIIDYDQSRGTIERTDLADQLDRYLDVPNNSGDAVEQEEVAWERYYLTVSALGTALVAGVALGVLPEVAVGGIIVAAFAVTTAAQMLHKR